MTQSAFRRPEPSEYLAYYQRYVDLVPDGDILATLAAQNQDTLALLRGLPEGKGDFRYAPLKWSIKELVGHVSDTERIFASRALRFGRNDATPLPGFDENDYVRNSSFGDHALADLVDGFESVRKSTIYLLKHMSNEAATRRGKANNAEVTVRALAWIIAGHERHHMGVLRTRYLGGPEKA